MGRINSIEERQRERSRLTTLSAIGAAIAGVAFGVAFASVLQTAMWPLLIMGVAVHLWGMIGARRLNAAAYQRSTAELIGYWACWLIIAIGALYVLGIVVL